MRVLVAPDSFKGYLSARTAALAIAEGWPRARPDDELVLRPMSDGGDGLLDVLARGEDTWHEVEVVGPLGRPRSARFLMRPDGTAVVETAEACGLAHVPPGSRDPLRATTYGVGELLTAARDAGAERLLVGLGGSATVDGGAGALTGLGFRVTVADGSGLKIGGTDLPRVAAIHRGWAHDWGGVDVTLLADTTAVLEEAAPTYGPQKGASPDAVAHLVDGLERWADVVERDLSVPELRTRPGTGAAGGLGFGLAAALGAPIVPGVDEVARMTGLLGALEGADLLVVGEGRLDATSSSGKVVGRLVELARGAGVPVVAIVGGVDARPDGIDEVAEAPADDPGEAEAAVAAAAERLAAVR